MGAKKQWQQPIPCKNIVERISGCYVEIDNEVSNVLSQTSSEYIAIQDEMGAIEKEYPTVLRFLDSKDEIHLTAEEHEAILRYRSLQTDIESMERLQIYHQGHIDEYAYLKRIGAL